MSIILTNLNKRYGDNVIVNNVSLTIEDGELFVLLGSSGSG
jgi:ABC-type sugar transport system ATPase subunit